MSKWKRKTEAEQSWDNGFVAGVEWCISTRGKMLVMKEILRVGKEQQGKKLKKVM